MTYRRDTPGPADDFDALGDPWARGTLHDRPVAADVASDSDRLDAMIAQYREQQIMLAQSRLGPQETWTPEIERAVYEDIERDIQAGLAKTVGASPHAVMSDDLTERMGDPFPHGHVLPMSVEDALLYTPESEREALAQQNAIGEELWRLYRAQYPWSDPDTVSQAAEAVAEQYKSQGSSFELELRRRGADAVLHEVYDQTFSVPPSPADDADYGRTSGITVGGHGGGAPQQDDKSDMLTDLQRRRPKWV